MKFNLIFYKTLILLTVFCLCLTGCNGETPNDSSATSDAAISITSGHTVFSSSSPNTTTTTSIYRPYSVPSSSSEIPPNPSASVTDTTSTPVVITPITVLLDRELTSAEKTAVAKFEKEFNAKVNTKIISPKEYTQTLVTSISTTDANSEHISVVHFDLEQFPSIATKCINPISLYYSNDECWDKDYLNYCKLSNKKPFGLATCGSWMCEDKNYILYYDPDVLKSAGITAMPSALYAEGKWNWNTQKQMLEKLKAKQITPMMLDSNSLIMLSTGADFVSFNNSSYSNNLKNATVDSMLTKSWMHLAELKQQYYITEKTDITQFNESKIGFYAAPAYQMHKERSQFTNLGEINAVPIAGPTAAETYIPFSTRFWGTPKNCPDEKLAIQFIHYMLNLENNPTKGTFGNSQLESVYNKVVSKTTKRKVNYSHAVSYIEQDGHLKMCTTLLNTKPSEMIDAFKTQSEKVEQAVTRINKDLPRIK